MPDPNTGVVTPQATPAPAQAPGQGAATPPPAQGGATGTPPAQGVKQVPLPALQEEREKRQAAEAQYKELQAEVENLKSMMNQYPQQQQYQQPYQQPYQPFQQQPAYHPYPQPPVNVKEQIDELWNQDIRKGFQAEMMAMYQYRDWVDNKVDAEFDGLRSRAEDFSKYEGKVRQYVRSLPYDARSQQNIVQAAYLMVKGQDADNIIKQREAEFLKKYQGAQGAVGLGGTFGAPQQAEGSQTLTQEERVAAQAMGMTEEDYLKNRG